MFDENIPVKVFTSYSHKDEDLREELDIHLAMIRRHKAVEIWNDRQIKPGEEWDDAIKKELESADIILLLFSPRFLASRYVYEIELKTALKRHAEKSAIVVPIILKPCDWLETEFSALQCLPRDNKAVTTQDDMDEVFYQVAKELKDVVKIAQARKAPKE